MKTCARLFLLGVACIFGANSFAQPFGLSNRVSNSTLQMPQNPATYGYSFTNAFSGVSFTSPIAFATPPGETNRLFILERAGRVTVITNLAAPNRTVFMDISSRVTAGCEEGLLGLAFHPAYASNGYFYLFYSVNTNTSSSGLHQRISRFQVSPGNPNQGMTNSELPLITQRDEACNHNGGDLHFGPDGFLYISVGDEGNQNDTFTNSQTIDRDFFSGILRIDVDKLPGNFNPRPHPALMNATNYFIPADNPFVGATMLNGTNINTNTLRAEFWAIGLRNPWRFSFDTNGVIYCGDVGGGAREEVNVIIKGGNYGWVWREGTLAGPVVARQGPPGFSYRMPIAEYNHGTATNQGNSITGGLIYRGNRISQFTGKYIFCDYSSGNIWSLTPNGTNAVPFERITGQSSIVAFGTDPRNSDVLAANLSSGNIQRLIYNTNVTSGSALPPTLADTGAFTNLSTLTPHAGVVPYDVNVPFWSDNAKKTRWFSIANTNSDITFNRTNNWQFPTGTVWVKHFDLELTNGVVSSAKRLETRLIVKNSNGVYGGTYRWGNSTTNATLVPEEGMDEAFAINDGGNVRTQVWHYPSRSECLSCHTPQAGFALGFNTAQLNRDFDHSGISDNQIRALNHVGYFSSTVSNLNTLPALAHATNSAISTEYRVRSYLSANCAQCHQPGGSALGNWDARIFNPLSVSGIVNGSLVNNLGDTNNRVIVPNDLAHSILLTRISTNGIGRMPPLASSLIDTQAVNLVRSWITNGLAGYQTFAQWQLANFGSTNGALTGASEDFDGDASVNSQEYLLGTSPTNALNFWNISAVSANGFAEIQFEQIANRGFEVQVTTNLQPTIWSPLDVPGNRPLFSATNFPAAVPDLIDSNSKFYRVRVFEP
ncbi:MAG: PQQ-dependent sugar dehydrogenase [Verrucomicrobiota bacterium]